MRVDVLADCSNNATARTIWPTHWRVSACGVGPEPYPMAGKPDPPYADMQPQQRRQVAPDRHLSALALAGW
jgi:hypothetical protein